MSTKENVALERRVAALEREILAVDPVRVRTELKIYRRGEEPRGRTAADVYALARAAPCVDLVGTVDDLDVVIDAESGCHVRRLRGEDPEYDEIVSGVREVVVPIACYAEQARQIVSDAPVTASVGGTRAGKTRVLVWWLFRQWLLRGHGVDEDHEIEAVFWWVRESTEKLYQHAVLWILRLWPSEVFVGSAPRPTSRSLSLSMIDGSRIDFKHAALSGSKAGTSLRSESLEAAVVDELSAIHHEENWREINARVAQTAGPIAVAYTPTAGHWSERLEQDAATSGGAISVERLTCFENPWWPYARIWVDLLKCSAVTATELEERILCKPDPAAAALMVVTDPAVRRMRFGEREPVGLRLWRKWSAERFTVRDSLRERDVLTVDGRRLPNVTATVFDRSTGARASNIAGGKDFNINPNVAVIFSLFGDPNKPHALIFDEIADVGPTLINAKNVARRYPGVSLHCDPTGAMNYRHESHGAASMSDAEEFRREGLECWPANGYTGQKVRHLPQLDSLNALHRAMHLGLIRVHARCTGLLRALEAMRAQPDGRIAKSSGVRSSSDQLSGYGDAMRYGLWPVYRHLLINVHPPGDRP